MTATRTVATNHQPGNPGCPCHPCRTTRPGLPMFKTQIGAPLVAYYGTLIDETLCQPDYVGDTAQAELTIPTLTRTPIAAIRNGDFLGDYVVMVSIPWVLPDEISDDEYTFEVDPFSVEAPPNVTLPPVGHFDVVA